MSQRSIVRGLALAGVCLTSALVLTPILAQAKKGKSYALLVGVRDYEHAALNTLAYTENDVEELAKLLDRPGSPFHKNVRVLGENESFNQSLERAGRVSDFLEFAELMCLDALHRKESCGGHFREEYQTPDGEALRDDENFAYVAAW